MAQKPKTTRSMPRQIRQPWPIDAAIADNDDNGVWGKGDVVREAKKRLMHKLQFLNVLRLISYFQLSMSFPKDELHQW